MKTYWDDSTSTESHSTEYVRASYQQMARRIRSTRKSVSIYYKVAASLLVVTLCSWMISQRWNDISDFMTPTAYISYTTAPGEQLVLSLPDGSRAWLNSSSTLKFNKEFRGANRSLQLSGEAFFEVKRDERKPFIVRTGNFYTQVLGTAFNIAAYQEDGSVDVTVSTGKVSVGLMDTVSFHQQELGLLTINDHVKYNTKSKLFLRDIVSANDMLAWREGRLLFKEASINKLVSVLQRWYGVSIVSTIDTSCTFTGSFSKHATLVEVLESLKLTGNLDYQVLNSENVTITAKSCEL